MKKKTFPAVLLLLAGLGVSCATAPTPTEEEQVTTQAEPAQTQSDLDWWRKSMEGRDERTAWFRDARFGMFVHWGVYSHLGGVWQGQPAKPYAEHIQRIMKIPADVYKENVAARFNPTAFNADEWIAAAKNAGMKYFVITAKHHDGLAMYDSSVSDYNAVKATPWKRDPMAELREAAKKQGIHFGFYYSHAWDWDAAGGFDGWTGYKKASGERSLEADKMFMEQATEPAAKIRKYVDGKVIPQLKELIAKYQPEILWFDTPSFLPVPENLRILKAVREAKPDLVVNGRITQGTPSGPPARYGDYVSTTDKPAEFYPVEGDWEGIPTTNESYAWHKMDQTHKEAGHFIGLLSKAAARGGNILLNVGPMGDGKIDPKDSKILDGIGAWMKVNAESIRGTSRSPLPVQAWGESTRKGNTLYLHVMSWPRRGRILVGGLKSNVKKAYLLADPKKAPLKTERAGDLDLVVHAPESAPDPTVSVVVLEVDGEIAADKTRVLSTDVVEDAMRVFDGRITGGLTFGSGKVRDAYAQNWTSTQQSVSWLLRAREKATYQVFIVYDADEKSAGGTYTVKLGTTILPGTIAPTPGKAVELGQAVVEPGKLELAVEGTKLAGKELMRLRGVILTQVGAEPEPPKKAAKKAAKGAKKKKR